VQTPNAMPLSGAQSSALLRAVLRELGGGLQAVGRELRMWRRRAAAIPDPWLRADALSAIDHKRGHTDGAALFWTLPTARELGLLRLLVTFEVIYDYLDNVSEHAASVGAGTGRRLFRALADALDPDAVPVDYYGGLPWSDDGGYLRALVEACQAGCRALPSFEVVGPLIRLEADRLPVLALNHEPDPQRRCAALRRWAAEELDDDHGLRWYELTAAASQSVVTFTLLALAADPRATPADAAALHAAYFPWFAYAVTMLDAYVDQAEDRRNRAHSYIRHYPSNELAVERLCESIEQSATRLLALPCGHRHAVMLGCMVAMYLSKDSATAPQLHASTIRIRRAGGTFTTLLVPVLRLWRICNGQRRTT
jgi:tetraprenyl-beta-curcumene synthase